MRSSVPAPIPLVLGLTALWLALFRLQLAFSAQGAEAPPIRAAVWINGDPAGPIDWRGAVTLVEFWTFGCWNCANVEPHVKAWHEKYGPRGLRVIGVHSPELAAEREIDNVRRHVKKNGITWPVAIDNDFAIWDSFGTHAWPTWYLVDRAGRIRYAHVGEGAYDETAEKIEKLLAER